ncbi:aspartic proteinase CDR1-like protein [Tanacetum coccineum]
MLIKIGTPPVEVVGIADTGSDITWARCKPCVNCYEQVGPPLLTPNSSTYRALSCQTKACKTLGQDQLPCDSSNKCHYEMIYGDMPRTTGDLAVDTFRFGSIPVKNVFFGCGHDNEGSFDKDISGIIGLGGGPNVVSTPLIKKDPSTFYYLTLESMLVGKHNISTEAPLSRKEGNIIIDSGTTLTIVPNEFYLDLTTRITNVIGNGTEERPMGLDFCYKNLNLDRVPSVTFRFTGADVEVPPANMFFEIEKGVSCLALVKSYDGLAIFGNLSQRNMLVGYDLVNRKVSFKPTDCTKHGS